MKTFIDLQFERRASPRIDNLFLKLQLLPIHETNTYTPLRVVFPLSD